MSTRALFNIILKIFGLLFVKAALGILTYGLIESLAFISKDTLVTLAYLSVYVGSQLFFAWALLFRTNYFIDKLNLTNGLNEQLSFRLEAASILNIAIAILGGYILIDEMPGTIYIIYNYFKTKVVLADIKEISSEVMVKPIVLSLCKILIAALLLAFRSQLVNYLLKKDTERVSEE